MELPSRWWIGPNSFHTVVLLVGNLFLRETAFDAADAWLAWEKGDAMLSPALATPEMNAFLCCVLSTHSVPNLQQSRGSMFVQFVQCI